MGLTLFSFLLLPPCLLWALSPSQLMRLMLIVSVFEAAAALTLGSFGVQPALLPSLVFIAYMIMQLMLGVHYRGTAVVLQTLQPFLVVTAWALVGSYVMPRLFQDAVYVWPQKATFPFVLTLLAPSPTNLNQDAYLAINALFVVFAGIYLASTRGGLASYIHFYFYSGFVAAAVSVWQLANRIAGVPYPEDLFYSNPGWAILTEQTIGAVPRINGPFSEPSSLASYMASLVCAAGWLLLRGNRSPLTIWVFIAGIGTVAISTSTTGFAVLALVSVALPLMALVTGSTRLLGSYMKMALPVLLFAVFLVATAYVFAPAVIDSAQLVIDATLSKQGSSSYDDRTSADLDSLAAMLAAYGLGVGWGSNRSSSLIPGLLANLGAPGFLGLVWFGIGVGRRVRATRHLRCTADQRMVIDACCGGLVGYLLGAMMAGPTINSLTFFFLLALLIACISQIQSKTAPRPAPRVTARAEPLLDIA